jgi:hypothetical protein
MKKIICFDSWTQGSVHFKRLVEPFNNAGYSLLLIHLGSWGHEIDRPTEEVIDGLIIRDISYYQKKSFVQIIKAEQPSGVLFLSIQAFAHRAFNRACKFLNIPTLHIYHGIINVQSTSSKRLYSISLAAQYHQFFSRVVDNIVYVIPTYISTMMATKSNIKDWLWFIWDIWRKISSNSYSGKAAPDTHTSGCTVLIEADVEHAVIRYGASIDNVFVVGNPDLITFNFDQKMLGMCAKRNVTISKELVYMDTALIEAGTAFNNSYEYSDFLIKLAETLNKLDIKMSLKLHPVHYRTGVLERTREAGIEIIDNKDLVSRLLHARGVIVEPSTVTMIPALLGVPVLLAQFGPLSNLTYGQVLTSYPRSRYLKNINKIEQELTEAERIDFRSTYNWISQHSGPMPPLDMPKRVVAAFLDVINNRIHQCTATGK